MTYTRIKELLIEGSTKLWLRILIDKLVDEAADNRPTFPVHEAVSVLKAATEGCKRLENLGHNFLLLTAMAEAATRAEAEGWHNGWLDCIAGEARVYFDKSCFEGK